MGNDRNKRGGKAGAIGGRTGGRGRNSTGAPGRSDSDMDGGRGPPASARRGGKSQARRGGRGSNRFQGSDSGQASAKPKQMAASSTGGQDNRGTQPRKKAKAAEGKILWSPGKPAAEGSGSNGRALASLASSFRDRYGDDIVADDTGGVTSDNDASVGEAISGRKRTLSRTGDAEDLEETVRSLSPARLAVEVQKARARAREQRFGSGAQATAASAKGSRSAKVKESAPLRSAVPFEQNDRAGAPASSMRKDASDDVPRRSPEVVSTSAPTPPNNGHDPRAPKAAVSSSPLISATSAPVASTVREPVSPKRVPFARVPPTASSRSSTAAADRNAASKISASVRQGTVSSEPPPKKPSTTRQHGPTQEKVHTLTLRLRSDVDAAASDRHFDGGVEEEKGFEPPNRSRDSGVEECKGFEPPNLPRAPAPSLDAIGGATAGGSSPGPNAPESPVQSSQAAPAGTAPLTNKNGASHLATSGGDTEGNQGMGRTSWGPAFGIPGQAGLSPRATSIPHPVAESSSAAAFNPWVLSSNASTFARNQGRPLAHSFPLAAAADRSNVTPSRKGRPTGASALGEGAEPSAETKRHDSHSQGDLSKVNAGARGGRAQEGSPAHGVKKASIASARTSSRRSDAASERVDALFRTRQERTGAAEQDDSSLNIVAMLSQQISTAAMHAGTGREAVGEAGTAAADPALDHKRSEEVLPGVRAAGKTAELLDRMKREREESYDFERKLTQALLDM